MKHRKAAPARMCLARRSLLSSLVAAALLGSACSTTGGKDAFAGYDDAFTRGDYAGAAAALASGEGDAEAGTERDVLRLLHRAEAQRLAGDYRGAIASYERAERGLKSIDTESAGERALEGVGSLAGASDDYEPYEAEKILINTYMALAHLSLAEDDAAGIQFRRAANRSERAVQSFENELAEVREKKLEVAGKSFEVGDLVPQELTDRVSGGDDDEAAVDTFEGYDNFIVPAASYLYGVYSMGLRDRSDAATAATAFRAVSESHAGVGLFESEWKEAERGAKPGSPTVWVVYENGRAPGIEADTYMDDVTVDTDSMAFATRTEGEDRGSWQDSVQAAGMNPYVLAFALPKPTEAQEADDLNVRDSAGNAYPLAEFSSMGSVRKTEFDKRRPAMAMTAYAGAAVKVAGQALAAKKAEEKASGFGGFAARFAGNATAATATTDTRSWRTLPSHWEAARFERPADSTVSLDGTQVALPDWSRTLIYVKRPTASSPLRASLIDLDGRREAVEIGL